MVWGCAGKQVPSPLVEAPSPSWEQLIADANAALVAHNYPEALRLLEQSLALQPKNASVLFKLGEIHGTLGQPDRARERFAEGLRYGESVSARNYLAYLDLTEGEYRAALVHLERALALEPNNLYAKALLGICFLQLEEPQRARETLEAVVAADPNGDYAPITRYDYHLGLAYRKLNLLDQAISAFQRAETRFPNDPLLPLRLGEIYEERRDWLNARHAYERAYVLAPHDKALRDKIALMTSYLQQPPPAEEEPLEPVPAVKILPDDISDRILASPTPDEMPDADAVILLNRSEHEILADGRSRFSVHQVVKIFNRRAISDYGEVAIPFNAASQNIGVNVARTVLADGSVVEVSDDAIRDVTPPESLAFNLYSDTLWKVISFPALEEGVVIEYQVTVEDAYGRGNTDNLWFWGSMSFQNKYPTLKSQYALRIPENVTFQAKAYMCEVSPILLTNPSFLREGTKTYLWEHGETPSFVVEPNGPPPQTLVPRMAFTSIPSWDALHNWYRDLLSDRTVADETIVEKVVELTAHAATAEERIRALAYFVAQECRYVAIQIGQGAFQPHTASEVLRNRYGDCKDKVTLLLAMLRVLGVDAYPALLQPAPEPDVDRELPSLAQFSHMILAVPNADGSYTWFDPSNPFVPFGELSPRHQGRTALLITSSGPVWATTPSSSLEENLYEWEVELELHSDGSLKGRERLTATGTHAMDVRATYQNLSERAVRETLTKSLLSTYPGVDLEQYSFSPLLDLETPVTLEVTFSAESFGWESGRFRFLPVPDAQLDSYLVLSVVEKRQQPLELNVPNRLRQRVVVQVPKEYRVVEVPRPLVVETSFASFRREIRAEGERVEYLLSLEIRARQVEAKEYPLAERLLELLAQEAKAHLVLESVSPPPDAAYEKTPPLSYRVEPLPEETPPESSPSEFPSEVVPEDPLQQVREHIEQWRRAWENKNLDDYLALYDETAEIRQYRVAKEVPPGFKGFEWNVLDKAALQEHLKALWERCRRIRVGVEDLRLSWSATDEVLADFTQRVDVWTAETLDTAPPSSSDIQRKIVRLRRFGKEWRIVFEGKNLAETPKENLQPATEGIRTTWLQRLEAWRQAWINRDNATYLALYAPQARIRRGLYNDKGQLLWREMSRDTFRNHLLGIQRRYPRYEVEILHPQVFQDTSRPRLVEVRFEQRFRAFKEPLATEPVYADRGIKRLRYLPFGENWLVVEETWTPHLPGVP